MANRGREILILMVAGYENRALSVVVGKCTVCFMKKVGRLSQNIGDSEVKDTRDRQNCLEAQHALTELT